MRLLFGVRVPDEARSVEIRPVFTGSSRPRLIFRGNLQPIGGDFDENVISDTLARDQKFWRWIDSEERARRLRTERNGQTIRFKLALTFFDWQPALIDVDPASGRTSLVTPNYEVFYNETRLTRSRFR